MEPRSRSLLWTPLGQLKNDDVTSKVSLIILGVIKYTQLVYVAGKLDSVLTKEVSFIIEGVHCLLAEC